MFAVTTRGGTRKSKFVSSRRLAAVAIAASLAVAGSVRADVISEKVPDGALAVLKFNNIGASSQKLSALGDKLGVSLFVPWLSDPLGALKQELKLKNGVKDDGEIAFVMVDPKGGKPADAVFALIPVTDYATLIANLEGAKTEGKITSYAQADGKTVYLADWGGYAAVSPTRAMVESTPGTGLKLPARAAKETTDNDLTVYANIAALRGPLTQQLTQSRDKAKTEIAEQLKRENQIPAQYHPAVQAAVEQGLNVVEAFLRDADAATIGLTLTEGGIKQNVVAEFKGGSYLAGIANGFTAADKPLLTGLPATKYLAFFGIAPSSETLNKLIDDLSKPVVDALPKDDEKTAVVPEYLSHMKSLLGHIKTYGFGFMTPEGAVGQSALLQPVGVIRGDADQILSSTKELTEKYAPKVNELVAAAQPGNAMKQTYTENVRTIDGVSFNSLTTEFTGEGPAANQQKQAFQLIYGAEKVDYLFGNAGGTVVSFLKSTTDEQAKSVIDTAKAGTAPLADAEAVKAVAANLPKNRFAEGYIALDEILATGLRAAAQFGAIKEGSVQVPPNLQPIGLSLASENNALEYTGYISSDLIQALVTVGVQAYQQVQQGGGGGQGGAGGGL